MAKKRASTKADIGHGAAEEWGSVDSRKKGEHKEENRYSRLLRERKEKKLERAAASKKLKKKRNHRKSIPRAESDSMLSDTPPPIADVPTPVAQEEEAEEN